MSAVTGQDRTSLEDQLAKMDLDHSGTINFIEFLYGIFQTRGESYVMEGRCLGFPTITVCLKRLTV